MNAVTQQPPLTVKRENDSRSWYFLVGALVLSGVGHLVTIIKMPERPPEHVVLKPLDMEIKFIEPPKPPPEVEKPPEPPKVKLKPPPVKVAEVKPQPVDAPPPPTQEAPPESKPAPVVIGISLDNTNQAGTFAAAVGNSTVGKTNATAVDPTTVKNYRAPKYVPPGGADTDPEVIGDVKIPYPEEAKRADVEGPVRLKVTVDFEGHVTEVIVMSGPGYGLDQAAAGALKRFKFKPAMKNGEAVSTTFVYTYRFLLD